MRDVLDIAIYESGSGGEMNIISGDLESVSGLFNQVYLALFGGNYEESTSSDLSEKEQRFDYWGNEYLETEQQFNSEFERAIDQVVLNSEGVSILEEAAKTDLQFLQDYADITVTGSIPGVNIFNLLVELKQPDNTSNKILFVWDGTKNELIEQIII